jgi:hypothetical protein
VNARTTNNYLLFLFGLVEPSSSDFIDVQIRSPTGQIVQSWNKTQANHATMIVRESGLYHLCFIKRTGASKELILYYSFDLISTGESLTTFRGF